MNTDFDFETNNQEDEEESQVNRTVISRRRVLKKKKKKKKVGDRSILIGSGRDDAPTSNYLLPVDEEDNPEIENDNDMVL
jgi:hypothetical protein